MTGGRDFLDLGDWNAVCSECGRKRKASEMEKNWQGKYRCPEHNETRHPQEYVRAVPDIQTPPWTQPPADDFAYFCGPYDTLGIADYAVADCAICDYINPLVDPRSIAIQVKVFLTSTGINGAFWQVPRNWDKNNNSIECIGQGGIGGLTGNSPGGGGGAYSRVDNVDISGVLKYFIGAAWTWFGGTSSADAIVRASAGLWGGFQLNQGGAGGQAVDGIGDVKYSGGNGGNWTTYNGVGAGGGGAAGPLGDGSDGADSASATTGGSGGAANNGTVPGGAGGVAFFGLPGSNDAAFDETHGVGSGGGGAGKDGATSFYGATGGTYGGGGGGGSDFNGTHSHGGAGLIVITYVLIP